MYCKVVYMIFNISHILKILGHATTNWFIALFLKIYGDG